MPFRLFKKELFIMHDVLQHNNKYFLLPFNIVRAYDCIAKQSMYSITLQSANACIKLDDLEIGQCMHWRFLQSMTALEDTLVGECLQWEIP